MCNRDNKRILIKKIYPTFLFERKAVKQHKEQERKVGYLYAQVSKQTTQLE